MSATRKLVAEHEEILDALRILEKVAGDVGNTGNGAMGHLDRLLDFFREFVDRFHHGKEEEVLFPALERRGVKVAGGPIGVMLLEHVTGRGHVRELAEGLGRLRRGDGAAAAAILDHAWGYGDRLRAHIDKENRVLFRMADRLLPEDVAGDLAVRYEEIERDRCGDGKPEAYRALLRDLKGRYGVE